MAAVSAIVVSAATARSVTITITGADFTPTTLAQLQQIINKAAMTCGGTSSTTDAPAAVTLPAGWV